MKIHILEKKINYNWLWEEFEVEDDFLNQFPHNIEKYSFEEKDWKIVWLFEETQESKEIAFNNWLNFINSQFLKDLEVFTSQYSQEEMQTWDLKVREAEKVIAGGTSTILDALEIPGRTTLDLAKGILQNSAIYFKVYTEAEKKKTLAIQELKNNLFNNA